MNIFKFRQHIVFICMCLVLITSLNCNQISEGQQRRKFEFLYKLSNHSSLLSEYTKAITFYKDLEFYEGRMNILYADVNRIEHIKDWGISRVLKERFLKTIDDNLQTLNNFKQKQFPISEKIKQEYDIIVMNERVDYFMKELNDQISIVGKE